MANKEILYPTVYILTDKRVVDRFEDGYPWFKTVGYEVKKAFLLSELTVHHEDSESVKSYTIVLADADGNLVKPLVDKRIIFEVFSTPDEAEAESKIKTASLN